MAREQLYSNGTQYQKHTQRTGGSPCHRMAAEGVWALGFIK